MVDLSAEAFEAYFDMWLLWVSMGKKFLPEAGGLNDQSLMTMQTILEIDSLYNRILNQLREDQDGS